VAVQMPSANVRWRPSTPRSTSARSFLRLYRIMRLTRRCWKTVRSIRQRAAQVPLSEVAHLKKTAVPRRSTVRTNSRLVHLLRSGARRGFGRRRHRRPKDGARRAFAGHGHHCVSAGRRACFRGRSERTLADPGAIIAVYVVLEPLRKYIHLLQFYRPCRAGPCALLGLLITGHELDNIGLNRNSAVIGIVKKNAIMMIDFALVASAVTGWIHLPPSGWRPSAASGRS